MDRFREYSHAEWDVVIDVVPKTFPEMFFVKCLFDKTRLENLETYHKNNDEGTHLQKISGGGGIKSLS